MSIDLLIKVCYNKKNIRMLGILKKRNEILKVFIDADACPVTDIAVALCCEHGIECILLCDTSHIIERDSAATVTVDKGADSVDFKLVGMLSCGDAVITQDYGLAAMCLAKKAVPLNQNGLIFSNDNIEKLLYTRYVSKKIRMSGGRIKGPKKRTSEQDKNFKEALISILNGRE